MASYVQVGQSTRVHICVGSTRDSRTFKSKGAARGWATAREAELLSGVHGEIPDKTFGDLLRRYRDDITPGKKGVVFETRRINAALGNNEPIAGDLKDPDPLCLVPLRDMDGTHVAQWRDRRLATGVKGATVQREWNTYSAACSVAIAEWKWLRVNPFAKASGVKRPPNSPHREELIQDDELVALQAAADASSAPSYPRVMRAARFAIETGMRASEIIYIGDHPEMVNTGARTAKLPRTKNGTVRSVPLSLEAIRLWEEALADTRPKVSESTDPETPGVWGHTSRTLDRHWRALRDQVAKTHPAVARLHFHDTRHTAATRIAKKLQVLDLCRMFGWTDPKRAMIYYNETAAEMALKL